MSRPTLVAVASLCLVALAVPVMQARLMIGVMPLDAVTLTTLLAIITGALHLRNRGWSAVSVLGAEIAVSLFIMIAALGCLVSDSPVAAYATLLRYAAYIVLAYVTGSVARDARARRLVAWSIMVGSVFAAAYGIWWYISTYLVQIREAAVVGAMAPTLVLRVAATFGNPNFYGEYLVLVLGVGAMLFIVERTRLMKVCAALIVGLQLIVLVLTYTRGSWLGLAVGSLLVCALVDLRLVWPLASIAAVAAAVVPGAGPRLASVFSLDRSAAFRLDLWRVALHALRDRPILGWGIGSFYMAFAAVVLASPELGVGFREYGAHNSYLTLLAETGVIGGLAFVWIVALLILPAFLAVAQDSLLLRRRLQAAALGAALLAFALNALTSNSFQHPQAAVFFWLIAGLLRGLIDDRSVGAESSAAASGQGTLLVLEGSMVMQRTKGTGEWLRRAWAAGALAGAIGRQQGRGMVVLRGSIFMRLLVGRVE